jgi:hypothetical protein
MLLHESSKTHFFDGVNHASSGTIRNTDLLGEEREVYCLVNLGVDSVYTNSHNRDRAAEADEALILLMVKKLCENAHSSWACYASPAAASSRPPFTLILFHPHFPIGIILGIDRTLLHAFYLD